MSEHIPDLGLSRALQQSQNVSITKIEALEARIADVETSLTDPSNSCKERKKLRHVKGKVQQRLDYERQNLAQITNAIAAKDYHENTISAVDVGTFLSPIAHLTHLQSPPLSPFMPFPMSPISLSGPPSPMSPFFSPALQMSFFPAQQFDDQTSCPSLTPGAHSLHQYPPTSPNYWGQMPLNDHNDRIGTPGFPSTMRPELETAEALARVDANLSSYRHDDAREDKTGQDVGVTHQRKDCSSWIAAQHPRTHGLARRQSV